MRRRCDTRGYSWVQQTKDLQAPKRGRKTFYRGNLFRVALWFDLQTTLPGKENSWRPKTGSGPLGAIQGVLGVVYQAVVYGI
jgi:hypothetical protein